MIGRILSKFRKKLPHTHVWIEDGNPYKRICTVCDERQSMMQSLVPSFTKPSLRWEKMN